jgi:hypothetical protein
MVNGRKQSLSKTIDTLTKDIYHVLDQTEEHEASSTLAAEYAMRIGGEFVKASVKRDGPRVKGRLWASDLGKKCLRQHHYNFNTPEHGEGLDGHTKFKFLYGNILEESVLYFAEESGHTVEHQQATVESEVGGWSIRGRIDAVIDGTLVDVKSTSSYGFKRYKDGIDTTNDSFGYLSQLGFYKHFNNFCDSEVDAGFVWIDKQNGHIRYTPAETPSKSDLERRATDIIKAVESEEMYVARGYISKPYGKSGNRSLDIGCSYCAFKQHCWRDANGGKGLRGFIYNQGPVWFTEVAREPKCPEIKDEG